MDIAEAVRTRKSIRAFKPDPVPAEILREIMELALRAPSWANTQPWEFAIVSGPKLKEIRDVHENKLAEPAVPEIDAPQEFPEPFNTRRRAVGMKLYEIKGIKREDRERRRQWQLLGVRQFGAPAVIYLLTDRAFYLQGVRPNAWAIFDCGLIAENIMLLANGYGLGTIAQIQSVNYPDLLRKALGMPESKVIVLGIAIGYPDWNDPVNRFHTERDPLDKVARWYGFDQG